MKKQSANRKAAIILSCVILLILAGSITAWMIINKQEQGKTAEIYQNGVLIKTIQLDTVTSPYTFTVEGENGASNTIEVRPGEIGIIEANCPDGLCINMGFIHSSALPITCLPNKVVIKVTGGSGDSSESEPDIDSIVR
ncbi:MAG: NusG domain II-containing protein [Lachnospiraceae bacterium]|nr:NusG domain II-containing protein [Lachnospiraceae bacterium]